MIRAVAACLLGLWAGSVAAVDLSLPQGSRLVSDRGSPFDSYDLPVAAFADGVVDSLTFEGRVDRQSWRVGSSSITTLQLLDPLRSQLAEAGFETILECDAQACGGFDFRFGIEVIPAPDMFVDIRDYRFLSARRGEEVISLIISRSRDAGYVQIIQVSAAEAPGLDIDAGEEALEVLQVAEGDLAEQLREVGHVVLFDLQFRTGTTDLGDASYASLADLAAFMEANSGAEIVVVGHTDATGDLDTNIALSRRRAEAVRDRVVQAYGIAAARIQAAGMGYLAPRASNLTEEGRARNRRVEAILLSLE